MNLLTFDLNTPIDFVEEFQKLYQKTPNISHWTRQTENCDYGDIIVVSKNCYLCFWSSNLEKCLYCFDCRKSQFCSDLMFCEKCELCYECVDCLNCYNCDYCQDCRNCADCNFCYFCIGVNNCFGCVNLKKKQYYIFNEQYSKEDYFEKLKEINEWSFEKKWAEFQKIMQKEPKVFMHQMDNEKCFGDYLYHSKNCYWCFDSYLCEDSMYIFNANLERGCKDCMDCGPIANTLEHCYDCAYVGFLFNCNHIYWCDYLHDCDWCINVWNANHCFGCVYMKHKEYHILNKPYKKEEYELKVKEFSEQIREKGIKDLYGLIHYKNQ